VSLCLCVCAGLGFGCEGSGVIRCQCIPGWPSVAGWLGPLRARGGGAGRTKEGIEASTRTRLVIADKKIWILGSTDGIQQVMSPKGSDESLPPLVVVVLCC